MEKKSNRDNRKHDTAEFFTDKEFIREYIEFKKLNGPFLIVSEPTAGDGRWLVPFKENTLLCLAADIIPENCIEIIQNMYGDGTIEIADPALVPSDYSIPGLKNMFTFNGKLVMNVVCADATEFSFLAVFDMEENKSGYKLFGPT